MIHTCRERKSGSALLILAQMAAACLMEHFPHGFWPIQNYGELAVFSCFVFLYMATRGVGIWSVDGVKGKG